MDDSQNKEESFEGEETVDYEVQEKLAKEGKITSNIGTDVYPDAIVNIARDPISAFQLKRKYDKKPPLLKLDPDFQRESVWDEKQKSELIESILMGIPLPLIYVKEDKDGVYIIVDGRQRLTTMFDFMDNKFSLQKLKTLPFLNSKIFDDLNQLQQNKIEDCPLTLHVIKPPTSDRVTFDLFDRVNRGGTRLNNQEMRNALYQGNATILLKQLSANEYFKKATDNSINTKRMKDRYLILRFIAFYLWRKGLLIDIDSKEKIEYKSDLEDFLSKAMEFLNDTSSIKILEFIPSLFEKTMQNCYEIFGNDCFRLPKQGEKQRRPVNMALFETLSYFIAELDNEHLLIKNVIDEKYKDLVNDDKYVTALTYTVDSNVSIKARFDKIEEKIREINNAKENSNT
jgi:uncharacterized protein with ParB-like and HNH nuclease domain